MTVDKVHYKMLYPLAYYGQPGNETIATSSFLVVFEVYKYSRTQSVVLL